MRRLSWALPLLLAACGGNGNEPDAMPGGIYLGDEPEQVSPASGPPTLVGIIDETGYARFVEVDEHEIYPEMGYVLAPVSITPAGQDFSTPYTAVSVNGNGGYSATMSGSIASRSAMTLNANATPARTFKLKFRADYTMPASLAALQGDWTFTYGQLVTSGGVRSIEPENGELSFDASGAISGSDSAGCIYSGSLSIDNPAFNAYRVSMNSSCLGAPLTGLAALLSPAAPDQLATILFIVNNDVMAFGLNLQPPSAS